MKVRVCIAVNDETNDYEAAGSSTSPDNDKTNVTGWLIEMADVDASRILWAEIEIPDAPAPIQSTAQEEL